MNPLSLIYILALVFFALATIGVPDKPSFRWLPAGLFCLALCIGFGIGPLNLTNFR